MHKFHFAGGGWARRRPSECLPFWLASWFVCLSLGGLQQVPAAVSDAQKNKVQELVDGVREAGEMYAQGDFVASAAKITTVQQELVELLKTPDPELQRLAQSVYARLGRAHGLLELEGAELEPLPAWEKLIQPVEMPAGGQPSGISFKADVAPWLISSCGKCHIENRRGEFSLASFRELMAGAAGAVVLFPGSAQGNRIVEIIESGDMPRGGGQVTPEQLKSLKQWIAAGAQFDGPDPAAPLTSYVAQNGNAPAPAADMQVTVATGNETVSFAKDVAPLLWENCKGCHIAGQQASGNLRMDSFAQLLRGGDSGPIIAERDPANSLLIQKLKGESGARMPAGGRPPLADTQIELIATWIREGATFDGPSPDMNMETVMQMVWAANASHAELFERRQERSLASWKRVLPNEEPATAKTEELFVLGNVPPERLQSMLSELTAAATQTKKLLHMPSQEPLIKGGISVFVLKSRYDYSEFGRMTESRELPKEWLGHWHADPLDAYAVVAADSDIDSKQAAAVALQVVSGASLGGYAGVPTWFAEGVARNLVRSAFRRGDPRVFEWQSALPAAMLKVNNAKSLLEGRLDEETAGLVGMNLTQFMMERTNRRRFDKLLELLRQGQPFDAACTATFAPPEPLVKTWLGK